VSEGNHPEIFTTLLENWQAADGGDDRCQGCPAHWSTREDDGYPGEPGQRSSTHGHRPNYLKGSLDPDILVLGQEPGPPDGPAGDTNHLESDIEDIADRFEPPETSKESKKGAIEYAEGSFCKINCSEYDGHFSQVMKCNEVKNGDMERARNQCCGIGCREGYLYDEIAALRPDYVITLGKTAWQKLRALYDIERLGPDSFTDELSTKEKADGLCSDPEFEVLLRCRHTDNIADGATVFPAPHPIPYAAHHVYDELDGDFTTKEYFEAFGNDVVEYMKKDR